MCKHEFKVDYIDAKTAKCCHKHIPNWTFVKAKIFIKVIDLRYNKIHKNVLLVMKYKFAYLDFVGAYKKDYSTRTQNYI